MSKEVNEKLALSYSNPADNYGSNNLRDLILVLHESGKEPETIYNVLNMIGVDKQRAYEAIEMYVPKKIEIKMEIKEMSKPEITETIPAAATKPNGKKKVEEALDIFGRASKIKSIASDLPSNYQTVAIKYLCEMYMLNSNNPGYIHSDLAKKLITELNQYAWIQPIADVINELLSSMKDHATSIHLYETYLKLKSSHSNQYFSNAINEIEGMLELTESEIRETGKYKLSTYTWIPEVKSVVQHINSYNNDLSENSSHTVVKKFSPIIEHDGGYVFNLHGKSYQVKDNEISAIDPKQLAAQYLTLIAVEENFKFSHNKMTFYKGKHVYEINLNEGKKIVTLDGRELLFGESTQLKNILMSTAHFGINEMHSMDMVVAAYENADKFVELDFVQSIMPRNKRGVVANIMRIGENVYLNKINTSMKMNEFSKIESATKAVEIVKEFIGYDISSVVEDLLSEDVKKTRINESKKNVLLDKITFLKEQKSDLSKQDTTNEYINGANKLITEEIEKYQRELNSML
jgi:hypothetical protein